MNSLNRPKLFLAPMEGVGSLPFRKAIATIGGFDECCMEFIRVPANAHIPSLVKVYNKDDTFPIPQAAQIMGSDLNLMAEMTVALEKRGAPRIDLNCGCPSNVVNGRGAGASLLKDPRLLHDVAKSMVSATSLPVTAKLRSGFEDTSLFKENLLAAEESGIAFLTLHPRTKREGYGPPANWTLIKEAKKLLRIPVVGNGDLLTPLDTKRMLEETLCDAIMIGRGAVINPFIFLEIKGIPIENRAKKLELFIDTFLKTLENDSKERSKLNHLKQLMGFLYNRTPSLLAERPTILRFNPPTVKEFLDYSLPALLESFS